MYKMNVQMHRAVSPHMYHLISSKHSYGLYQQETLKGHLTNIIIYTFGLPEFTMVILAYTCSNPKTVMIKLKNTAITIMTMF